ncbi:MAG: glycosyltransferase N-terminal domain-containing protein [Hyphomicrobium sp.]
MASTTTTLTGATGRALARLIKLVAKTSQTVYDPPDLLANLRHTHPCIVACWHGQFMMLALLHPGDVKVSAMVARHGDAELIGEALKKLNTDLIRGAGAGGRKKDRGGASALRAAMRALHDNASIVMTADVPPGPARRAGEGIITLARMSGVPIVPVAAASSRFTSFDTWSRMTINLPYSKLVFVGRPPIHVPNDADAETLAALRAKLETELNTAMTHAYRLAGADISRATPKSALAAANPPKPGLRLKVYSAGLTALKPAAPLLLSFRERRGKEDPARRGERFGAASRERPKGQLVWVHAASVGETIAALPLINELIAARPELGILVTTGTTTSAELAARRLPPGVIHQFIPLDSVSYVRAFFDHWQPDLAVITESEIWPNLILEADRRKIPLALINARMSPRSMKRWRRFARLARPLFSRFAIVLAQNDKVARTITYLGAPNVVISGNLKIDAPPPPVDSAQRALLEAAIGSRKHILAASTHAGEELMVARAHRQLAETWPKLLTIIVPRHPDRAGALQTELAAEGFIVELRSVTGVPSPACQIFICDTIGELGTLYALSPVAFIGGSLVAHGGQNPIEAVRHGAAVITGPHVHNFRDSYDALFRRKGAREVTDAASLAEAFKDLLSRDDALAAMRKGAEAAISEMSGALRITRDALLPILDAKAGARRAS